jgi:hypothetical protein
VFGHDVHLPFLAGRCVATRNESIVKWNAAYSTHRIRLAGRRFTHA